MVIVKESRKEFDNLFEDEKAILDFEEKYITLTFSKQFSIGKGKVYKKGESLFYEIFNNKELKDFVRRFDIKKFPMKIYNNDLFLNLFYFMGGQ
jgi:hypothetical protein